jgi:DNA-binding MarR family transcriptional regulator
VIDTPDRDQPTNDVASSSPDDPDRVAARAVHMMGRDAEGAWSHDDAMAWEGMLELSRRLRRQAEDMLTREEDLSVSMLGILGRLVRADDLTLRPTELAAATGLSISRVSRIIRMLEHRGMVECRACPTDARATDIMLTARGRERTEQAQHRLFVLVQDAFAARLAPEETATLARVFARLLARQ